MPLYSKYKLDSAFTDIPIASPKQGIHMHLPPEVLHTFGTGIYLYFFQIISDIFGINTKNKWGKSEIESLYSNVVNDAARQSVRNYPRRSDRKGVLGGAGMTANERRGSLFMIALVFCTCHGRALLGPCLKERHINYWGFIEVIFLLLAFEKWLHGICPKVEVGMASE